MVVKAQSKSSELKSRFRQKGRLPDGLLPPIPANWWWGCLEVHFGDSRVVLLDSVIRCPVGQGFVTPIVTWALRAIHGRKFRLCMCRSLLSVADKSGEWVRISCPRPACELFADFRPRTGPGLPDLVIDLREKGAV